MATLGMNGFGRIGRYLTRILMQEKDPSLDLTVINARADNQSLAHLLKYDSVHGRFQGKVDHDDDGIIVNGKHIKVTRDDLGKWRWKELGVDIALETTGKLKTREEFQAHIDRGARKAIVSAPTRNVDAMIVMGVNHHIYDPAKHFVISNASCTTNCLAPAAKVLNDTFGIKRGLMTTVHSFTMDQRILDNSHRDLRRARTASLSIIPTTTGAAKAVTQIIPELEGKLDGLAVRVPTPDCSLVDLVAEMERDVTIEGINAALKAAADGPMKEHMEYTEEPLVSIDMVGTTVGGVVDGMSTMVMGDRMAKVLIWYDNEAGFCHQMIRNMRMVAASL